MKLEPDPLLQETVLQPDGTQLRVRLAGRAGALRFRLEALRDGESLLCYDNDAPAGARRIVRGRAAPYAFRSAEQLRYDFERDLEAL